jgi:hypothetical protein
MSGASNLIRRPRQDRVGGDSAGASRQTHGPGPVGLIGALLTQKEAVVRTRLLFFALAGGLFCLLAVVPVSGEDKKPDLPLVFQDDFAKGAANWEPTDPKAWKVVQTSTGKVYNQFRNSKYKPKYRSPLNISLIKDVYVSDFILEAQVQSTGKDGPHRDMCLFFGHQDASHFYYVHLAKQADDHANQVFIVNGAARKKISTKTTPGTKWDAKWHHVKIVRTVKDGAIAVYFDDMKKPVMTAEDKTFVWGRVGLGSFDDSGNWQDVKLYGVKVEKPKKNSAG